MGEQFLYGLSLGEIAWVRESPLTRVELRCHCSRDSTISRFLATVYQVCRHYVASEMENISQRGDIAEGVLNITRSSLQCLQAINTPSCRSKSMSDGDCWLFIIFTVIKIQRLLISRKKIVVKRENNSRRPFLCNNHFKEKLEVKFYHNFMMEKLYKKKQFLI